MAGTTYLHQEAMKIVSPARKYPLPLKQNILDIYLKIILQVHIVYMGEKYHNDLKLVTDSHLDLLASVVGRYASSTIFFFFSFGFDYYLVDVIQAKSNKQILLEAMKQILFVPDTTWNRLAYDLTRSKGLIKLNEFSAGILMVYAIKFKTHLDFSIRSGIGVSEF
jgi:hypothetical protein